MYAYSRRRLFFDLICSFCYLGCLAFLTPHRVHSRRDLDPERIALVSVSCTTCDLLPAFADTSVL